MILSCQNINKSFVTDDVLKDVSFHLEEREKVCTDRTEWCRKVHTVKNHYAGDAGRFR